MTGAEKHAQLDCDTVERIKRSKSDVVSAKQQYSPVQPLASLAPKRSLQAIELSAMIAPSAAHSRGLFIVFVTTQLQVLLIEHILVRLA